MKLYDYFFKDGKRFITAENAVDLFHYHGFSTAYYHLNILSRLGLLQRRTVKNQYLKFLYVPKNDQWWLDLQPYCLRLEEYRPWLPPTENVKGRFQENFRRNPEQTEEKGSPYEVTK